MVSVRRTFPDATNTPAERLPLPGEPARATGGKPATCAAGDVDSGPDGEAWGAVYAVAWDGPIVEQPESVLYFYLTTPRVAAPRWYHEGLATFLDTWMAGGLGRAQGPYDEMVFRTKALENGYFFDIVGLESEGTTIDFQVGQNSYLYGTRFITWLGKEHGPEKLIQWFDRSTSSRRYFSTQFRQVYGVALEDEWRRWIAWEHEWQKKNLATIREYPVTQEKAITSEILGSVSRSFYDADRKLLYAAINRPGKPASIASIDIESGKITPLTEVVSPALYFVTSMAYDAKGRKILFTSSNSRGWRSINELDLGSGRTRMVLKNARTGDLVVGATDDLHAGGHAVRGGADGVDFDTDDANALTFDCEEAPYPPFVRPFAQLVPADRTTASSSLMPSVRACSGICLSTSGVRTNPGQMTLARTPWAAIVA